MPPTPPLEVVGEPISISYFAGGLDSPSFMTRRKIQFTAYVQEESVEVYREHQMAAERLGAELGYLLHEGPSYGKDALMHATLEQQIAYLDEQVIALRSDVERLQALVAKVIAGQASEPAVGTTPKRGPGRPRKSGPESEPVTFGDAARGTDG